MTIESRLCICGGQLTRKRPCLMRRLVNHSSALSQHNDRGGEELLAEAITIGLPTREYKELEHSKVTKISLGHNWEIFCKIGKI